MRLRVYSNREAIDDDVSYFIYLKQLALVRLSAVSLSVGGRLSDLLSSLQIDGPSGSKWTIAKLIERNR